MPRAEVIAVTGASAGVGRAVVRLFAHQKAKIGLIARDVRRLNEARQEVEAAGGSAVVIGADVADARAVQRAADTIEDAFGAIDVWVNNAMVTVVSEFKDMSPEEFQRVTDVTYHGYVNGTRAALQKMYPRNRGVIVQVGSALAYRGIPLQSAYCGAKHAIQGFSEAVRSELMHHHKNIHITMVQLPAVNTPQFSWCKTSMPRKPQPVPPIYQPEVAAQAILWSAHHPTRRELTVGGRNTIILWGNKFFPGLGDRYLAKTGYGSQMTDRDVDAQRRDNLFEPVPGPFSARGSFSDQAKERCWQLYLATHVWVLCLLLFALIALAVGVFVRS